MNEPGVLPTSTVATNPRVRPSYKWRVVVMLWFICFFNYADRQAISSVFPKLKEEFGFDAFQLGLIGSAFMWVYAAGAPLAGFIGDRVRRKDLILGGCLFWSFITMTTGFCSRLWHFVTVRALEGFGETFYFPASMSLLSDYHGPSTRSRALSFHQSSVYLGTILGSWAGAWFAENHGWRTGFYVFGGAGIILALILYRSLREPIRNQADTPLMVVGQASRLSSQGVSPSDVSARSSSFSLFRFRRSKLKLELHAAVSEPETPSLSGAAPSPLPPSPLGVAETLNSVFRSPAVLFLMLAFLGANFVATIFLTWTPTFLVEKFHFKLTNAGLTGAVFIHLASAVSVPLAGLAADRLVPKFAGGRMLVQAAGLLIGASFVFIVGKTCSVGILLLAMTAFGFCKGLYDSGIFASLYDAIEPRARATAAGLMNTVGWAGGALGPLFVGLVTKFGKKPTEVENMSDAIAWGGAAYLGSTILLTCAIFAHLSSLQKRTPLS